MTVEVGRSRSRARTTVLATLMAYRVPSFWTACAGRLSGTAHAIVLGRVQVLEPRDNGCFAAILQQQTIIADAVLLATGAEDVQAPIGDLAGAIRRGIVRHCPTCDAYEVRDRRMAILGAGECRMQEAMLLRSYTADLTVLSLGRPLEMADDERAALQVGGRRSRGRAGRRARGRSQGRLRAPGVERE